MLTQNKEKEVQVLSGWGPGPQASRPLSSAPRASGHMTARKQFLLRIDPELWADLESWAADELRSVNGQIEYLLREAMRKRKGRGSSRASAGSPPGSAGEPRASGE